MSAEILLRYQQMIKISQSRAKTYRRCKQAFHYKYIEDLTKKAVRRPFQFGKIVHRMIEAYAEGDEPEKILEEIGIENQKLFAQEKEMYGNLIDDIRLIMDEYFNYWDETSLRYIPIKDQQGVRRLSEHPFEIEIETGIIFTGIIDGLSKTPENGLKWLTEHKTFKSLPNDDQRWRNLQAAVYLRAVDILGWVELDGICWDYIKSTPPKEPQLLKSGKLSTKQISTLPAIVKKTVAKHNLDIADYQNLVQMAEASIPDYFQRIFTPMGKDIIDVVFNDFVATAREIADYDNKPVRNIDLHCSYCDYEPLCRGVFTNSDIDFIKEREYVKRSKEDPTSDTEAGQASGD